MRHNEFERRITPAAVSELIDLVCSLNSLGSLLQGLSLGEKFRLISRKDLMSILRVLNDVTEISSALSEALWKSDL